MLRAKRNIQVLELPEKNASIQNGRLYAGQRNEKETLHPGDVSSAILISMHFDVSLIKCILLIQFDLIGEMGATYDTNSNTNTGGSTLIR